MIFENTVQYIERLKSFADFHPPFSKSRITHVVEETEIDSAFPGSTGSVSPLPDERASKHSFVDLGDNLLSELPHFCHSDPNILNGNYTLLCHRFGNINLISHFFLSLQLILFGKSPQNLCPLENRAVVSV